MTSTNIVLALAIARFLQSAECEMSALDRVILEDEIFYGYKYWDQKLLRLLLGAICANICGLLFGLKFLLGAEDRAHECTREFPGHSDIAIRSYAPTYHLAWIREVEWGHSALAVHKGTDRPFHRNGIQAPSGVVGHEFWRTSMTYFSPTHSPRDSALRFYFFIFIFGSKKLYKQIDWLWHFAYRWLVIQSKHGWSWHVAFRWF